MQQTPMKSLPNNLSLQKKPLSSLPTNSNSNYVTVICRLKPLLQHQQRSKIDVNRTAHSITISEPSKSISKTYDFDQIFDECTCQDKFVNYMCNPIIDFLKNGGDTGLIFSYGITNSGKTYSILGTPQNPGILLNLIKKLSKQFKNDPIRITACELYKDEFYSLKNKGEKLNPREFRGTYNLQDCQYQIIHQDNMEELFSSYLHNRAVSPTIFNSHSSRSHAIFKIQTSKFKIGVVDLAGSERYSKNVQNFDIKQTIFINQSLLTLKKCIKALQQRSIISQKVIVPYRQSKLTQSLMQYFNPTSKINIIVNINQARHCLQQNLMVMDYTSKAKNISSNSNSDFAMMIKNSHKKYDEMKSGVKSEMKKSGRNKKKTMGNVVNQDGVIREVLFSDEEDLQYVQKQILRSQRKKLLKKKIQSTFFDKIYKESQKFRHYLEIDEKIKKQKEQKQFEEFKNMNITKTQKKVQPYNDNNNDNNNNNDHNNDNGNNNNNDDEQYDDFKKVQRVSYNNYYQPIQPMPFAQQYGVNTYQSEKTSQQIQKSVLRILSMNTSVKKRLKKIFDEQKRLNMKDQQTCFSADRVNRFFQNQRQNNNKENDNINDNVNDNDNENQQEQDTTDNIDIFNEKSKSDFSTPSKKKNDQVENDDDDLEEVQLTPQNINFLTKSIKKSLMIFESGVQMVKSGFKKAISNIVRKTNKKNQHQPYIIKHSKTRNLTLQSQNLNFTVIPQTKQLIDIEIMTDLIQQSIEISPHHLSSYKEIIITNNVFTSISTSTITDMIQKLDVGIQLTTDDFIEINQKDEGQDQLQNKYFEEQVVEKLQTIIKDKKQQINNKKKNKRGYHNKNKNQRVVQKQKQKQKTAFKNFSSASKSFVYQYSIKKKAHIQSSSKSNHKRFVAKNTRAAKRNKQVEKSTINSLYQV